MKEKEENGGKVGERTAVTDRQMKFNFIEMHGLKILPVCSHLMVKSKSATARIKDGDWLPIRLSPI